MLHPSSTAVDYVYTKMKACFFDSDGAPGKREAGGGDSCSNGLTGPAARTSAKFEALQRAVAHRTLGQEGSEAHRKFCLAQLRTISDLSCEYPFVDLSNEKAHFEQQLTH